MITVCLLLCVTAGCEKVDGGNAGHSHEVQEIGVYLLNIFPFTFCFPGHFGLFGGQFGTGTILLSVCPVLSTVSF